MVSIARPSHSLLEPFWTGHYSACSIFCAVSPLAMPLPIPEVNPHMFLCEMKAFGCAFRMYPITCFQSHTHPTLPVIKMYLWRPTLTWKASFCDCHLGMFYNLSPCSVYITAGERKGEVWLSVCITSKVGLRWVHSQEALRGTNMWTGFGWLWLHVPY